MPWPRSQIWRLGLLVLIAAGSLGAMLSVAPIRQSQTYHHFADQRPILGVANCLDVVSNIPFLLVGSLGVVLCVAARAVSLRAAWLTCFAGVALVSAGSSWYHSNPSNATLVWDRLPITIAFMGLWSAVIGEYVSERLGKVLLAPAVLLGVLSVLYWHWFDDLRLYAWIQAMALLTIPVLMILFRPRHTHQWLLLAALVLYGVAKIAEAYDVEVFEWTRQLFSGHTLKHLLAALSCLAILAMLWRRRPAGGAGAPG
jgi:hypothetical protein